MTRLTILLDCDGVMIHHDDTLLQKVNERFGKSYEFEDIDSFSYSFMTPEEREYIHWLWEDPRTYDDMFLTGEVLHAIAALRRIARVVACSVPMVGHVRSKTEFLRRYFHKDDIVLCDDKTLVQGDILVDDGLHNLEAFRATGRTAICYTNPWNRGWDGLRIPRLSHLPNLIDPTSFHRRIALYEYTH